MLEFIQSNLSDILIRFGDFFSKPFEIQEMTWIIIPIIIMSEIPFPIPLSVILSPSHIINIEPAVKMITDPILEKLGENASGGSW